MSLPDRSADVRAIVEPWRSWLRQGHDAGDTDSRKRKLLPVICRQLHVLHLEDAGLWGVLVKEERQNFIPADILVWQPTLEHVDVLTDDGATWGVKGLIRDTWRWQSAVGMAEPGDLTPPPPPPVTPYDESKAVEFGLHCNDVYRETTAPIDPGMIAVMSARAAYDYYVLNLRWPESRKKHINELRAVYGLRF